MRILRQSILIAAILGLAIPSAPALAQAPCLEGRTAQGTCVDASLASIMRQRVRVFTQPRLSYSGAAVAPSEDRQYDVLRDRYQGLAREIYGACQINFCP